MTIGKANPSISMEPQKLGSDLNISHVQFLAGVQKFDCYHRIQYFVACSTAMSDSKQLASKASLAYLPWPVQLLLIAAAAALYRKRGGFLYRSVAAVIWLLIIAAYGMFASLILPIFGQRKLINWTVARLYYYCAGYFTAISATVENEKYLSADSPAVYICNHQSSLDVMLMARVFPKATSVVAKKSIKYYPILGWYMSLSQAIFLDRSNRDSAVASAKKAADDIHRKQTSVFIFPEGTRGHPREINMLPFKKGAFHMAVQAGVPIVPIVIANYNDLYDSKSKRFESGVIPIKVLAPISTTGLKESSDAVDKLATETRELMLAALREISTTTPSKKSD